MAQSAAAGRLLTTPSGVDVPPSSPLSSRPFVFRRRSHTGRGAAPTSGSQARPRSASNLLGIESDLYAGDSHTSVQFGETVKALQAGNDVAALIDFLRNHPPPPDNFMSTPYGADDEGERGRWSKIKKMGKRSKSAPRAPQNLRLPDSAVSGVTIGGHRHIAISIPLNASPFGEDMRSQYPVYAQRDLSMGTPSKEPLRTYTNDKGVVTVLRPVTEVSESSISLPSQPRSPCSGGQWPLSQGGTTSHASGHRPSGSLGRKPHDYIGILPTRFDTPLLDDSSAPWNLAPSREGSRRGGQSPTFQRSAYPTRSSSMTAGRNMRHPASIDGLISQPECRRNASCGHRNFNAPAPVTNGAVSKMYVPTKYIAKESKPNEPINLAPIVAKRRPSTAEPQDSSGPKLTVISDNPIVSRMADSPPSTPGTPKSRKEAVRDKRRRDMEAVRSAKHKKTQSRQQDTGETETSRPANQLNGDARGGAERDSNEKPAPQLTMSSVMVVMDMEPCLSLDERASLEPQETSLASEPPSDAQPDRSKPLLPGKGTPPQNRDTTDRTSLTRRREWKAIREQERNARDAMALARAKAQKLASGGMSYESGDGSEKDNEVLRLYEAYREHRLKDMERRLRRLERNGDVWMKALVPVLDDMKRVMAAAAANEEPRDADGDWALTANEEPRDADRDWASDDEASSMVQRVGRDAERRKVTRRTSMSQGRLLEKLAKPQQEDEGSWSDDVSKSDDFSGLGTIEPLMRELAGEARRRRGTKTARTLAICDEATFHAM